MAADSSGATGLAGRYATALFELAEYDKQLDEVAGDLQQLGAMIDDSEDLSRLIKSPVMSRDDQVKAMDAISDAAGFSTLTKNFVGVVAENRRLFALAGMIKAYQTLLATSRGEVSAEVVSAKALSDNQVAAIESALKEAIGSKVQVEQRVDETLLGGLVVRVGSRMIDNSLKTKLQKMRLAMKGIG
ncbi:MAG: F0F1 ATP synthase subunit delta [Rhodospirillales bacterium]|nr:F0F1 ATP synthase subunit delta [Rhodospirillales bacterium]MBO6788108.1 F0F1 ATP synthase subunit delta [Rhodospirillales bacterium]